MRKVTFRMAALEAEPELSGVPELLHSRLYEEELAAKFPAEVEGADEALNAAEIVRETLNTTRLCGRGGAHCVGHYGQRARRARAD